MGTIIFENNAFIYTGEERRTVLLDCTNFLSNKSRIPMHSFAGDMTVSELILSLIDDEEQLALADLLLDILVTSQLTKTAFPVKVLEIGAASGIVSYHLATLLGRFHPESFLCSVSDSVGNDSENRWLDYMVLVEKPPKLSFLAGDYDDTHLREDEFDLIVINGRMNYENSLGVICEAERLIKEDGTIICYSVGSSLLEKNFRAAFPQVAEYPLSGNENIMITKSFEKKDKPNQTEEIYDFIKKIKKSIAEHRPIEIEDSMNNIQKYLEVALKEQNTDLKIQLIDLRDNLLDYLVFSSL